MPWNAGLERPLLATALVTSSSDATESLETETLKCHHLTLYSNHSTFINLFKVLFGISHSHSLPFLMLIISFSFFKENRKIRGSCQPISMCRFYIVETMLCSSHLPSTSGFIPLAWSPFPLYWAASLKSGRRTFPVATTLALTKCITWRLWDNLLQPWCCSALGPFSILMGSLLFVTYEVGPTMTLFETPPSGLFTWWHLDHDIRSKLSHVGHQI